jgi:hypothetical protein
MDLEQQLRESYAERLGSLDVPGGDAAVARRTGAGMRTKRRVAVGAAAVAVIAVALGGTLVGSGRVSIGPSHAVGHWRELPDAPLSPRANSQSVWTGHEVIVLGGETKPCPPNADCVAASDLLRDGAAYEPSTNAWHRIADAPVPVGPGDLLLNAGGRVLLRHAEPREGSRLFVYDPGADQWTDIPSFFGDLPSSIGDDVYGFRHGRVVMYDAARGVWNERIPRDPLLPRLAQRRVTATPAGPVVTGLDSTQPNDGRAPSVVLADVWDGRAWHRLPATGQLGNDWYWTGSRMVDPDPAVVDGGEVDPYPRPYPAGGILDPASGRWTALPAEFKEGGTDGWGVNASGGRWVATYGQVYDTATGRVWTLPRPDDTPDLYTTAAWTDQGLLVFGGVDSSQGYTGKALTDHAWLYTP